QLVLPLLIEAEHHVQGAGRGHTRPIRRMQIADELSRRERYLADATFQEVARQRGLRHAQHLRPWRQRIALREDLAQAGEIALVIPLSGGELRDGELDAHPEKLAYGR